LSQKISRSADDFLLMLEDSTPRYPVGPAPSGALLACLEIGLERSIDADGWSLSAEGTFSQDVVSEFQETNRSRSLSFDLGLDLDPSPHESLGIGAGLALDEGSDGNGLSSSVLLTYDLQF
jgi:hypothetical protein